MEEKKEKKTIKCSYAVLVIILFAALAFVTDYAIIERKTRKCDCPKCEATNNEVISDNIEDKDNTDNTQVTENNNQYNSDIMIEVSSWWNGEGNNYNCKEFKDNYCLMPGTNDKIELYRSNKSAGIIQIKVGDRQFKLENGEFYAIDVTDDGNIFAAYDYNTAASFILLDQNLNIITNFENYFVNGYPNSVKYEGGKYVVSTFYKGLGCAARRCGQMDGDDIYNKIQELKYIKDGQFEVISSKEYTFNEVVQLEKDYCSASSCDEYLNR